MKYITLITALLVGSCYFIVPQQQNTKSYQESTLLLWSSLACEFYGLDNELNKDLGRKEFEFFLSKRYDGELVLAAIQDRNYGFLEKGDDKVLFYDWGIDLDDDKLRNYYTLRDSNKLSDGDLLLFEISKRECKNLAVKILTPQYFSKGEIVNASEKINRDYIVNVYEAYIESVFSYQEKDEFYVPKKEVERKKYSIIYGRLEEGQWNLAITKSEHNKKDISKLIPKTINWLYQSKIIQINNIDEIFIPIKYYEPSQLEKL
jgi:hypothetical protein